ncbi:uncharacterized protein MYCGRDRAFT_106589, partial [Zymoseptoria tritici IPO323]
MVLNALLYNGRFDCLYPFDERQDGDANRATLLPQNRSRHFETTQESSEEPGRYSRESTVPLDESEDPAVTHTAPFGNGLQLTFSYGPKAGPGFLLGTDPNSCDIVLPRRPGISRRHCYLTFDSERRLTV